MAKNDYHKMSVAEKELHNRQHDIPARCPVCYVAIMPMDEESHVDRCVGQPPPGPRSRWVSFSQALKMGITGAQLSRRASDDRIRTKGEHGHRRYLLRDITRFLAARKRLAMEASDKPKAKQLTKPRRKHQIRPMKNPGPLKQRVIAFVDQTGSYSAASRKLDVPIDALKRCAKGDRIRKGTEVLIESQLGKVSE